MTRNSDQPHAPKRHILNDEIRPRVESEVQTATIPTRDRAPSGGLHELAPGRAPGDVDESRAIPTDIVVRQPGEPDAVAQGPAAAPSMTDEEAGLDDKPLEGGITPLVRR